MSASSVLSVVRDMIRTELRTALPSFRWGVVEQRHPLRVTLDGETAPVLTTPDSLITGLEAGMRVFMLVWNRRMTILGKAQAGGYRTLTGDGTSLEFWRGLPDGWYWVANNSLTGMPQSYGFVRVMRISNDIAITYYNQTGGYIYHASLNAGTTEFKWHTLLGERAYVVTGSPNLNDYVDAGDYFIDQNAVALAGANFPINTACIVEVRSRADHRQASGGFIYQRLTAYQAYPDHVYTRGRYNGTWSAWQRTGNGTMGGYCNTSGLTQNTVKTTAISLPPNRYMSAPVAGIAMHATVPQNCSAAISNPTTAGFSIYTLRTDAGATLGVTYVVTDRNQSS